MTLTVAQLFNDAAKKLRAEFEYIRSTNPHPGEKGAEAENVVRDFLNHHLPQRFRATSGIIIDKANSLSPQTDVIIYDALISPVYRYSEEMLMLPLDRSSTRKRSKTDTRKSPRASDSENTGLRRRPAGRRK
jgi:hypothetical protein